MAKLVPCLVTLRDEFNKIAPNRSKESDGWIGDAAHQNRTSDHNPDKNGNVHAIDVDKDLNAEFTMEDCVQYLLKECRKSGETGLDRGRFTYIIYNRRIWEADNNWRERPYTGSNLHKEHAHFSSEYNDSYTNDTRSYGMIERFGEMTKTEFFAWMDEYYSKVNQQIDPRFETTKVGSAVIDHQDIPWPLNPSQVKGSLWQVLESLQNKALSQDIRLDDLQEVVSEILEILKTPSENPVKNV